MDSPLPSFSRIRSTVTRVPATTGFPIITLGSETIMGSLIVILLAMTLADSPPLGESRKWVERRRSAAGASNASSGPLKRLVRLCIRRQGRHLCDDPDEGSSGNVRFRVGGANSARVVAPVEEPDDVGLLPTLPEGQRRHDHQV